VNEDAAQFDPRSPDVEAGGFQGYCEDFEYAWRWEIRRDGDVIHHGASLSRPAAMRAIDSMIRVFGIMETQKNSASPPDN